MTPVQRNWFDWAQETYSGGWEEACEFHGPNFGHKPMKIVIDDGPLTVFDAEEYRDTYGFCPGDDDVSRTISATGGWEPLQTAWFDRVLRAKSGVVIDFGAHVGWYTMRAARRFDCKVVAINGCAEFKRLLDCNVRDGRLEDQVLSVRGWVGPDTPLVHTDFMWGFDSVRLVKMDIEGNEHHALRTLDPWLAAGRIDNLMVEISPVFNGTYPGILQRLMGDFDYRGIIISTPSPIHVDLDAALAALDEWPQIDMLFTKERL